MSLFGAEFFRNQQDYLGLNDGAQVDTRYKNSGYLFLGCDGIGEKIMRENHEVQRKYDSKVELLSNDDLKKRYPRVNVDDIVLASFGTENEGWFDPWALLNGFKNKAISLGAQYVTGEVVGFGPSNATAYARCGPNQVHIRTENGGVKTLEFDQCVIATGYESGKVSRAAGIGTGLGELGVPLPVEPRKRYVYYIHAPELEDRSSIPHFFEPNGVYCLPERPGYFLTGRSPPEGVQEPPVDDLEVDNGFFEEHIWSTLAHRVPAMENVKVKSAWAGYYDYNTFDQNAIIGKHPVFKNLHFVTGFSGHGIQQSPAAGRAIMELLLQGSYQTIDLTRFGFERVVRQEKVPERNII